MTDTNDNIVERFKTWRGWCQSDGGGKYVAVYEESFTEAIDLIEQQANQLDRKELIILALKARVANWDEMKQRIAELEAELESRKGLGELLDKMGAHPAALEDK